MYMYKLYLHNCLSPFCMHFVRSLILLITSHSQEELARAASTSTEQSQQAPPTQQAESTSHGVGGAVNRPAQVVKAFSGKGHSLMDTSPSASRRAEGQEMVRPSSGGRETCSS